MATIKNIIFDLGGVLLNIDYHLTKKAFIELGYENFDDMYNQFSSNELFEQLEMGKLSNEAFYENLMALAQSPVAAEKINQAWNAMLLDFRKESLDHLKKLKNKYQLFLLSNTNDIHWQAFDQLFRETVGSHSLDDYFTRAWYSHKIGYRKPNEDIFEFILRDAGIRAEETLFIDDSINNIEAARQLGIHTHHLLPGEKIEDLVI